MHRRAQKQEANWPRLAGSRRAGGGFEQREGLGGALGSGAPVAEAKLAEARDTEVALRMALHGDAASDDPEAATKGAEGRGRYPAVERRAEGLCSRRRAASSLKRRV